MEHLLDSFDRYIHGRWTALSHDDGHRQAGRDPRTAAYGWGLRNDRQAIVHLRDTRRRPGGAFGGLPFRPRVDDPADALRTEIRERVGGGSCTD